MGDDLSVKLALSAESRADLEWWLFSLEKSNGGEDRGRGRG